MNQERAYSVQKERIKTEAALFTMSYLETFYRGAPKTNKSRIDLTSFNQTNRKEKQTMKSTRPSIVINSFACLCPACANCDNE